MAPSISEQIYRMSPEYKMAYQEGYEAAKQQLLSKLKSMEPFTTFTGTSEQQ